MALINPVALEPLLIKIEKLGYVVRKIITTLDYQYNDLGIYDPSLWDHDYNSQPIEDIIYEINFIEQQLENVENLLKVLQGEVV